MSSARTRNPLSRNLTWSLALVAIFLVVVTVIVVVVEAAGRADTGPGGAGDGTAVREDSRVLSEAPEGAPVLVEFLDFECEACGAWYPHIEQLREDYDGRVQFVARYFPLPGHKSSVDAALAVEAAAQQGQLEQMYNRMYETQTQWGESPTSQKDLFRSLAEDLGLDMAQFDRVVADPATLERVQSDVDDGIALGVQGTPTFFLDDRKIEPQSPEEMRELLEAALDD